MGQGFSLVNPKNFMKQNTEQVPDWMANVADNLKVKDTYQGDWESEKRGVFAEYHSKVQRQYADYEQNPRDIAQSFTAQKLKGDAKISLAKFLTSKRYQVNNAVAGTDFVTLQVSLDAVPANFVFSYEVNNGKLIAASTFLVEGDAEYPHSKAGLEECLADIKNGTLKTGSAARGLGKAYMISREEVIRRFNGSLREATNAINSHLEEGALIGVGSNTYASFFDVEQLFPQQEKTMVEKLPEFEFVKNKEHVATNPHKSAQQLSVDAMRILSNTFSEVSILGSNRNDSQLFISANVLNDKTGIRTAVNFTFDIEAENIGEVKYAEVNNARLTMPKLIEALSNNGSEVLSKYLAQTKVASSRAQGSVLTRGEVKQRLHKIVDASKVDALVDRWIYAGLVQPLNSSTFTSKLTFEELLAHSDESVMTSEAIARISTAERHFGEGMDFERDEKAKDKVRLVDEVEASDEARMLKFVSAARKYFKDFIVSDYQRVSDSQYNVTLNFDANGINQKVTVAASFEGAKLVSASANVQGQVVSLDRLASAFKSNSLLAVYAQTNNTSESGPMIISEASLVSRLATLINSNDINHVVNSWLSDGRLKSLGNNLYASKESFASLLNNTKTALMSADEMKDIAEIRKYFGDGLHIKADYDKDTGVRNVQVHVTDEGLFQKANAKLASMFKHYSPVSFNKDDDNYILRVELANDDTGLRHNVDFVFHFDGDKVASVHANLAGKKVEVANLKKAFAVTESLSKYLETTAGKHHVGPMVIKTAELTRRLTSISSEQPNTILRDWEAKGMISYLDSETVASNYSFEEMVQASNVKALSDEEITTRIARSARDRGLRFTESYVQDTGDRLIQEKAWSPERLAIYAKDQISSMFKDFELLDAQLINGAEPGNILAVTAAFVNPFSGLREKVTFHYGLDSGIPNGKAGFIAGESSSRIASINELGDYLMALANSDEAVAHFTSVHGATARSQRGLISHGSLASQLQTVIPSEHIADVIDSLVRVNVLKPVNSQTYACDYTMPELVQQLSKMKVTDVSVGKQQTQLAVRDERRVNTSPEYHVTENDTRAMENNSKVAELLGDTKTKIQQAINVAHQGKRITSNKHTQLTEALKTANTFNNVQQVFNELKRYFE